MKNHEIDRAMKKPLRYWYDDGLTELAAGFVFVLIGLLFYVETILPQGFLCGSLAALGLPVLVIGGGLLIRFVVRAAKERITYPRTGYVSYPRQPRRRKGMGAIVAAGIGIMVALILIITGPASLVWIPLFEGIIIGAFLAFVGHRFSITRFYVLGFVSVVVGAVAALTLQTDVLGIAAYFAVTGVAIMVSGALTLINYLRHTQPPRED